MTPRAALYRVQVRDAMRTDCAALPAAAACSEAVARLREDDVSCVVVTGEGGIPVGILTERDVARRIAFLVTAERPLGELMTAPVVNVSASDFLFHAVAAMRRLNIRHMPVVDDKGALAGVLRLKDALFETDRALMEEIDALATDGGIRELGKVKAALPAMAGRLQAEGVPVPEIQALLSEVNNDIYRRATEWVLGELAECGFGVPPAEFAVIVMGSIGRGESFIHPDQDNGLILADYPDAEHNAVDGWFIAFAERLTQTLHGIGFDLCHGGVMAVNPLWRKSIGQWKKQISLWVARPSGTALRMCDILLDFRAVFGPGALAQELRRHFAATVARNRLFLRVLAEEIASGRIGLGFFDRFTLVRDDSPHRGTLNLKQSGLLPLIEAVRLKALAEGLAEISTLGRMDALLAAGSLDRDEHDDLTGAYRHLSTLILRHQVEAAAAGEEISYYVDPDSLTRRERDVLVDGLKAIARFRDRVRGELTGALF